MGGAFQTSREIFDNPIWKNIVEFRLFFLIYGNAVFSDEGVRLADDLVLQRGEWCRSTRKIQEDLSYIENRQVKVYSTSVINRCIKKLERSQRICTRIHELGTVFTVLNYEQYQGFEGYKKRNLEHNLEHSENSGRTVEEQSENNNKNVNNVMNDMNEFISSATVSEPETLDEVHRMIYGHYTMNGMLSGFIVKYKKKGFTDAFVREVLMEAAESCNNGKPSIRQIEAIAERWERDKIYSRAQNKQEKIMVFPTGGQAYAKSQGSNRGIQFGRNSSKGHDLSISDEELDGLIYNQ